MEPIRDSPSGRLQGKPLVGSNYVVLQLAHRLKLHSRYLGEGAARLAQCVLGRTFERLTIFIEIGAQHRECRDLGKRIEKRCAETWQNIEVAAAGLDERKEARTIDALATSQNSVEVSGVVNDEVEGFESAITRGIHKIDHTHTIFADIAYDVSFGELLCGLAQICNHLIGVEF